jgi:hypothetical protein
VSHGRHTRAARFLEAVNVRNVGMIQGREALRFAREPREAVRVVRERVGQDLERDIASCPIPPSPIGARMS